MSTETLVALLTLLGVFVGLLVSTVIQRWTVATQNRHDAEEREKERVHALKRDVFVPATEALHSIPNLLSKLTNEKADIDELGSDFAKATQKLAGVSMVASAETSEAVGRAIKLSGAIFTRALLARIPLDIARAERDLSFQNVQTRIAENQSLVELMKQFNISGSEDHAYFLRLKKQTEFVSESIEKYMTEGNAAALKVKALQPALIKSLLANSRDFAESSARATSKMRMELGLPWDEEAFVRSVLENFEGATNMADEFLHELANSEIG